MIALGNVAQVLEHRARLHQLDPLQNPLDIPLVRWRAFLIAAKAFYADEPGWAMLAADLGWQWWELIGLDDRKPFARLDRSGLLWFLHGCEIAEIDETSAMLVAQGGAVLRYYRKKPPAINPTTLVAPWDFHTAESR